MASLVFGRDCFKKIKYLKGTDEHTKFRLWLAIFQQSTARKKSKAGEKLLKMRCKQAINNNLHFENQDKLLCAFQRAQPGDRWQILAKGRSEKKEDKHRCTCSNTFTVELFFWERKKVFQFYPSIAFIALIPLVCNVCLSFRGRKIFVWAEWLCPSWEGGLWKKQVDYLTSYLNGKWKWKAWQYDTVDEYWDPCWKTLFLPKKCRNLLHTKMSV